MGPQTKKLELKFQLTDEPKAESRSKSDRVEERATALTGGSKPLKILKKPPSTPRTEPKHDIFALENVTKPR